MLYFCLIKSCLTSRSADNPLPLVSVPRYPTGLLVKGFRTRSHRPDCPTRRRSTVENCQELFKNSVGYATFPRREISCLYRPLVSTRWWHQNFQLWIYRHLLDFLSDDNGIGLCITAVKWDSGFCGILLQLVVCTDMESVINANTTRFPAICSMREVRFLFFTIIWSLILFSRPRIWACLKLWRWSKPTLTVWTRSRRASIFLSRRAPVV